MTRSSRRLGTGRALAGPEKSDRRLHRVSALAALVLDHCLDSSLDDGRTRGTVLQGSVPHLRQIIRIERDGATGRKLVEGIP